MIVLDVNDAELTISRDDHHLYRSPGIALVTDAEIKFGEAARQQSRLHPRQSHSHYFYRMNTDPLPETRGNARTQADLVYLHLKAMAAEAGLGGDPMVVATSGTYTPEQLGVLLGIAGEAGLAVTGFIDSAVAACATRAVPDHFYFVDMHLHMCAVTELKATEELSILRCQELAGCGLASLIDGWVNVVADQFVQEARFDPLHLAETEQQLYDRIQPLTHGQAPSKLGVEVRSGGETRRVEVLATTLAAKAAVRMQPLADLLPQSSRVVLSARTARALGVQEAITVAGHSVTVLDDGAVADGCARHVDRLTDDSGQVRRTARLPVTAVLESAAEPTPAAPSHVVSGGHAFRLPHAFDDITFALVDGVPRVSAHAPGLVVTLEDEPLQADRVLGLGEVVRAGAVSYQLVRVID